MDRRELVRRIPVFSGMSDRELELLVELTTVKRLERNAYLFHKGEPGHQVYAVMEGRLKAAGRGRDGKEVVFRFMDPGEVIGEIAFLDAEPRSATVQAVEDSTLLTLHRRDLLPFLERNPKAAIKLASVLAQRIRSLSELVEDRVFLGLPPRLAKKLLALASRYGKEMEDGLRIDLKLPQHQLGELVGTSRESINKQLRRWSDEGVLHFAGGYVTIKDRARLEELASLLAT
jgi:CRP-like cAMP-binding protein